MIRFRIAYFSLVKEIKIGLLEQDKIISVSLDQQIVRIESAAL
jgi:hypothetical protein